MSKTILITGATDGIGLETAKRLYAEGHTLLLHGRNSTKLAATKDALTNTPGTGAINTYQADLSRLAEVDTMAEAIRNDHPWLDALINNAGVFKTPETITQDGLDVRFVVNTIAPYRLTQHLLPRMAPDARVVNLSSAAQAQVDLDVLRGEKHLQDDLLVYAQSKLALTMWNNGMAASLKGQGPAFIAVNPGSLLASKMVKEGFGVAGKSLSIGAEVLVRAALSGEFSNASGLYFDNDKGSFGPPHPDALNPQKCQALIEILEQLPGESVP